MGDSVPERRPSKAGRSSRVLGDRPGTPRGFGQPLEGRMRWRNSWPSKIVGCATYSPDGGAWHSKPALCDSPVTTARKGPRLFRPGYGGFTGYRRRPLRGSKGVPPEHVAKLLCQRFPSLARWPRRYGNAGRETKGGWPKRLGTPRNPGFWNSVSVASRRLAGGAPPPFYGATYRAAGRTGTNLWARGTGAGVACSGLRSWTKGSGPEPRRSSCARRAATLAYRTAGSLSAPTRRTVEARAGPRCTPSCCGDSQCGGVPPGLWRRPC